MEQENLTAGAELEKKQTDAQKKKSEKAQDRDRYMIQQVCSTAQGKRLVKWLLNETHVFHQTFNTDSKMMSFNEGKRSVGLKLLLLVQQHAEREDAINITMENKLDD